MNAQTRMMEANDVIADESLDAVSGGTKADRYEVTREEYDRILARMIADSRKK